MDAKDIRGLIELISTSNVTAFELEADGVKLKLVKEQPQVPAPLAQPVAAAPPAPVAAAAPASAPAAAEEVGEPAPPAPVPAPADGLKEVTSPIVGTFYRASSPETSPFVEVGTRISRGQVVCIVEAMKVMNEIESELDGEIVEILVANGQPVEYGEPLFRIRPLG